MLETEIPLQVPVKHSSAAGRSLGQVAALEDPRPRRLFSDSGIFCGDHQAASWRRLGVQAEVQAPSKV